MWVIELIWKLIKKNYTLSVTHDKLYETESHRMGKLTSLKTLREGSERSTYLGGITPWVAQWGSGR